MTPLSVILDSLLLICEFLAGLVASCSDPLHLLESILKLF